MVKLCLKRSHLMGIEHEFASAIHTYWDDDQSCDSTNYMSRYSHFVTFSDLADFNWDPLMVLSGIFDICAYFWYFLPNNGITRLINGFGWLLVL